MPDRSSAENGAPWHRVQIWWPVECVPVALEIVHPRRLTALEFAVLRVVDEFREAPPTLGEVAEELGVDAGFLSDALRATIRLGALRPRNNGSENPPPEQAGLPELDFSPTGYDLYRRGLIEGEPAAHGETFYFDALTDESIREPPERRATVPMTFPRTRDLPTARESVGLDRAREIVRRYHADLVRGDGEVRQVGPPRSGFPSVQWTPVSVEMRIGLSGDLDLRAPGLSGKSLDYLRACDPVADVGLANRPVSGAWSASDRLRRSVGMTFDQWRRKVAATVPVADVPAAAARLVGGARAEIVLHAAWTEMEGMEREIDAAAQRGVRVLVVGAESAGVLAWGDGSSPVLGVRTSSQDALPCAMVADGRSGLVLDDVQVGAGPQRIAMELVGVLAAGAAVEIRAGLIGAAFGAQARTSAGRAPALSAGGTLDEARPDPDVEASAALERTDLRLAVARVTFRADEAAWRELVQLAVELCPGLARIVVLRRLGALVRVLVPSLERGVIEAPAVEAWNEGLKAVLAHGGGTRDALLSVLARAAPDGVAASTLVEGAVEAWVRPRSVAQDPEPLETLLAIDSAATGRWGKDAARGTPRWRDARDACLRVASWTGSDIAAVAAAAQRTLDRSELANWARRLLREVPEPVSPQGLRVWIDQTRALRDIVPAAFRERAIELWQSLLAARPDERDDLLRQAVGVVPAEAIAPSLLGPKPSTGDVDALWRALRRLGYALDAGWWKQALRQILPAPDALPTAQSARETVRLLAAAGADWHEIAEVGRAWASGLVGGFPAPTEPAWIAWWLRELAPLRPLLGDEVESRVTERIRRLAVPLREARARTTQIWRDTLSAWSEIGLSEAGLIALVEEGTRPAHDPSRNRRHGKTRRKRQ